MINSNSDVGFTVTRSMAMNRDADGAIIGVKGYLLGKIFHIANDTTVTVGRDTSQCQVILMGDAVSRVHCQIRYNSFTGEYTVTDCSTNGIIVDGRFKLKPKTPVKVQSGSTLSLGNDDNQITLG